MSMRMVCAVMLMWSVSACSSARSFDVPAAESSASAWGFTYTTPDGWKAQDRDPYTILGSDTQPGVIGLARSTLTSDREALDALSSVASTWKLRGATVVTAPADTTIAGMPAVAASYDVVASDGSQGRVGFVTLFSNYGTSLTIVAITTPDAFDGLASTTTALADSVRAGPPRVNDAAVRALVGTWDYISDTSNSTGSSSASHSVDATITFDGSSFSYSSTSTVFVDATYESDSGGYYGDGASENQTSDSGSYLVIGSELVCKGQHGSFVVPFTLDSHGLTVGGRTYLRDSG